VRRNFANWLDAYADWADCTEAPRDFHYWSGVAIVSAVLGRRVWHDKWFPNTFVLLVGPGESAVSTARDMLLRMRDIGFINTPMTTASLFKDLMLAEREEELGDGDYEYHANAILMGEMKDIDRQQARIAEYALRRLWDGETLASKDMDDLPHRAPAKPLASILAYATPQWGRSGMSVGMMKSGLLSRMSVVCGEASKAKPRKPDHALVEQKLLDDLFLIQELAGEVKFKSDTDVADTAFERHLVAVPPRWAKRDLVAMHRKLAMIHTAAGMSQKDAIQEAYPRVMSQEDHRKQAFRFVGTGPRARAISAIIDIVEQVGELPAAQLADQMFVEHAGAHKFTKLIMDCMDSGVLIGEMREGKVWVKNGEISRFPSPY
jgi:hypothetical protein